MGLFILTKGNCGKKSKKEVGRKENEGKVQKCTKKEEKRRQKKNPNCLTLYQGLPIRQGFEELVKVLFSALGIRVGKHLGRVEVSDSFSVWRLESRV